jgi:hypothetical protein
MNNGGYKCLLTYLSMECYKKTVEEEYLTYEKFKDYSFLNEKEWTYFMNKLCKIKLAVKKGDHYITRSKYKEWRRYTEVNDKKCLKFNGNMYYDMSLLYTNRGKDNLKDLVYIDLRNSVVRNKSISRKWVCDLTGVGIKAQKRLEKKYEDDLLIKSEHHIPVDHNEVKKNKVGKIPTFDGYIDHHSMSCFKTKNKSKQSNCRVIQLGNKIISESLFSRSWVDKTQYKQRKGNLSNLNKVPMKGSEVKDWYDYDLLVDSSKSGITKRGIISCNDKKMKTREKLKKCDFQDVSVISENGGLFNIRSILN